MKLFKISAIIVFYLLSSACLVAAMYQPASNMSQFEDFATRAMEVYHIPGASIALVENGKIIYAKGFGYRDIELCLPVTPETVFAIGSCTKAFTATAVGMLVDQGKLEWDAPIKKYIPDFKMYDKEATENLSLRDCLCHRSGLPGYNFLWDHFKSRSELVSNLRYLKPNARFREKWQYNNLMYVLAGYVIETITGNPWTIFVQENIARPLGMQNTYFSASVVPTHPNAALAYEFDLSSRMFKHVEYNNLDLIGPAASIHSSVLDMAQWVIVNLTGTGINPEIHKPQMLMVQGEDMFYCLGWGRTTDDEIMHEGGTTGCSAFVGFLPKKQIGFVALSNIDDNVEFNAVLVKYAYACMNNEHEKTLELEKVLSEKVSEKHSDNAVPEAIEPEKAISFVGTYHNDVFGDFIISISGTNLTGRYAKDEHIHEIWNFAYVNENTFKDIGDENCIFRFKKNHSGQSVGFEFDVEKDCPYEFVKI